MKKLFFPVLTALCLLGFQTAQAQIDVTINPVGLLFGDFSVGADFALSENFSIEPQIGFGSNKVTDIKGTNIGVNGVAKYYFNPNHGADRFYADVFLRFINRQWKYDDGSANADFTSTRFGLGFGLGWKIVSGGGFVFDIGFGAGRALVDKNKYEDSGTQEDVDWPSIMFQGKLGIGYRFGGGKD